MGKIYKIRQSQAGKKTLKEALKANHGTTLDVPKNAISMAIDAGIEVEVTDDKK